MTIKNFKKNLHIRIFDITLHYITLKNKQNRFDVYETLCPQQVIVHKGGQNKNWGGECRDITPAVSKYSTSTAGILQ